MKRHSLRQSSSITINNPKHTNISSSSMKTNQLISSGQKNILNQSEYKQSYLSASKTSRTSIYPNESLVGQSIQMHLLLKKSLQQSSSSSSQCTTIKDKSEQLQVNNNNSILGNNPAMKNTSQIPQAPLAQLFGTTLANSKKSLREMYTSSQFEEKIKEDLQREISKLLDRKKEESLRPNKKDSKRYSGSQDSRNENIQGGNSISSLGFITIDDNQGIIDMHSNKQGQQSITIKQQRNGNNAQNGYSFIGGVYLKDRKSREGIKGYVDSDSKELLQKDSHNTSLLHLSEQHPASELIDMLLHANSNNGRMHKPLQKQEHPPNVVNNQFHKNTQKMSNHRKQSLPAVILKENALPKKILKKRSKFKVLADYIQNTLPPDGVNLFQHNSLAGIAVENSRGQLNQQGQGQSQNKRMNELIKGEEQKSDLAGDGLSDDVIENKRKGCQCCLCNCCAAVDVMESSKIIIGGNSNSCKRQFRSTKVSHRNDVDDADDDNGNIDGFPSKSFHERMFRASKRDLLMRDYLLSDRRLYQPGEVVVTNAKSLDTTIYSVMEQQDESIVTGECFKKDQYEEQQLVQKQKQVEQADKQNNNVQNANGLKDTTLPLKPFETRGYRRLSESLRSNSSSLLKMPSQRDDWMGKISSAIRKSNEKYRGNHGKEEQQEYRKLLEQQIEKSNRNDEQYSNQQVIRDTRGSNTNNKFGMHERGRARRSIELKSTFAQDQASNWNQKYAALPIIAGLSKEHQIAAEKPNKNRSQHRTTTATITNNPTKPRRILPKHSKIQQQSQQQQQQQQKEYQQKMEYSKILQRRARSNADAKLSEYAGWEHVKGEIWPDER